MEGEVNNLILVWTIVVVSLCYCHTIVKIFSTGKLRIVAILPIICLFLVLPLHLTSIYFGGITSFFVAWLANSKLLLFAFNKGPLSSNSNSSIPLSQFIASACFPIKIQESDQKYSKKSHRSSFNYITKIIILVILVRIIVHKRHINFHPHIVLLLYCFLLYFMLEMILALFAALAKALVRVELEPQFNEPYMSTSLQDFWGRRWNLMVTNILHPTIYVPVRSISGRFMARRWTPIPGILATFLVSGLMHELIFYNIGRLRPTWEMTGFFVLHGVSLSVEIVVKKIFNGKFNLPTVISVPLTVAFVIYSSFWLFFPPFFRAKADVKSCTETLAFVEFVKNRRLVDATEISCPFI